MKKAWEIISTVFVWIVVAVAAFMMIFTIISVNTFNRSDRNLFGFKAFIVLSDSMSATDFDAGDLVLIKEVDPVTLRPGDIITYQSQNSHNYGESVTHKIRSLTTAENGEPGFITYGTTTNTDDEVIVTYPYVQGKYVGAIPKVGTFFTFLKTPQGYILCILLPFLVLILCQGVNCVKVFRAYKKEQMDDLQREKDAIAAERKQNEEMMRQLMLMQQQMQQMQQGQPVQNPIQMPMQMRAEAPVQTPVQAPARMPSRQTRTAPQASAPARSASAVRQRPAAPARSAAPAPQRSAQQRPAPVRQQTPAIPMTDDSDVDDMIAELSALCGRTTD